jgi:hypothetical protein
MPPGATPSSLLGCHEGHFSPPSHVNQCFSDGFFAIWKPPSVRPISNGGLSGPSVVEVEDTPSALENGEIPWCRLRELLLKLEGE